MSISDRLNSERTGQPVLAHRETASGSHIRLSDGPEAAAINVDLIGETLASVEVVGRGSWLKDFPVDSEAIRIEFLRRIAEWFAAVYAGEILERSFFLGPWVIASELVIRDEIALTAGVRAMKGLASRVVETTFAAY